MQVGDYININVVLHFKMRHSKTAATMVKTSDEIIYTDSGIYFALHDLTFVVSIVVLCDGERIVVFTKCF